LEILGRVWRAWKRVGQFIGDWIARVVLTVFYFTLFLPFGIGVRLWGDPLATKDRGGAQWLERAAADLTTDKARRLF
jgi:hypothetical protein